jgi:hypothetical protein
LPASPTASGLIEFSRANGFGELCEQLLTRALWSAVENEDCALVASLLLHPINVDAPDSAGAHSFPPFFPTSCVMLFVC